MKRKRAAISVVLLLCIVLLLLMMILLCGRKKDSYNRIPIGDGQMSWGMSTDEIIGILGEPASMDSNAYQDTLFYDTRIPSDLGICSSLILYIGKNGDAVSKQENDFAGPGLGSIEMKIEGTTKEKIRETLTGLYGELTVQKSEMERDLKKAVPEYFKERYYTEKWYAGELEEEQYSLLEKNYQAGPGLRLLQKDSLLFFIDVSGTETGDSYACDVELNAVLLSYLLMQGS